ncbi:helix-turn-helix domain-containing protein [Actinoplanes sp. CA-142083]|uniref:helix-turn-helix domain-containing protein n=1 Tax=Actinoplanes sp. CA-142083 TaxID=3239903 RepID=UPI003D8E899A
MARPPVKITDEQERLLKKVNRTIDNAQKIIEREEDRIWAAVKELRDTGMPDVQICRRTGLNRSTLQRKLGPRVTDE